MQPTPEVLESCTIAVSLGVLLMGAGAFLGVVLGVPALLSVLVWLGKRPAHVDCNAYFVRKIVRDGMNDARVVDEGDDLDDDDPAEGWRKLD